MCEVYSGAFVNIAASASVNSHGGLFLERNPLTITPCITTPDSENGIWIADLGRSLRKERSLNVCPLSPRAIQFTETKVYLECCEGIVSDIDLYARFEIGTSIGVSFTWAELPKKPRVLTPSLPIVYVDGNRQSGYIAEGNSAMSRTNWW